MKHKYPDNTYFYLHIGKTGGQSLANLFHNNGFVYTGADYGKLLTINTQVGKEKFVIGHTKFELDPSLSNTRIIFFYRDPIDRFISAFHYLKNKLKHPKLRNINLDSVAKNWSIFLEETTGDERLTHLKRTLADYTLGIENLQFLSDSLFFVGDYNNLEKEAEKLSDKMKLKYSKLIKKNTFESFSGKNKKEQLSDLGKNNLENYFSEDYKIIKWLKNEFI